MGTPGFYRSARTGSFVVNVSFPNRPLTLRLADLTNAAEVALIHDWVLEHPASTPFHRPCWLKAVEAGTGQQAHMLVAERGDAIVAVLPFHLVHSPFFGRALVSSGFGVDGGILSSDASVSRRLAMEISRFAERWSCHSIELRGGFIPTAERWTVQEDAHAGFVKPLQNDDMAELLAMPRKQRADVRKGLANGLTVEIGCDQRDLDWHYAVYAESVRNLGTPVFPKALMGSVLRVFGGQADILTVLREGRPVASVLSLYHRTSVMPYWGGGVRDARRLRANDVMYFALMNHARRRGCTHFDFGRSKTGSGAYYYKKNWGFVPEPLRYALYTVEGQTSRDLNPNSSKYRAQIAAWQKLPLAITNRLGPWIAKGLG